LAASVLALALRFESEIFLNDLYAAEDLRPAAAVLALAVALYFEFHLFLAALYAAEDCRPAAAVIALAVALYLSFHFFFADLYAAEDVLTAKAALTRGVLRLSESDLFTAAAALARRVFLLSESRFARFTILAWTRSFSLVLDVGKPTAESRMAEPASKTAARPTAANGVKEALSASTKTSTCS
jgi:hypothetical protein